MTQLNRDASRDAMIDYQLRARGISSPAILDAMRRVAREAFVPVDLRDQAYNDSPLPIAAGQTISQPYIVARMLEALNLKGGERVLDVGTGSGYAAAVVACIAKKVYSIERIGELARQAEKALQTEGFTNIEVRIGDGTLGWPEAAPFDAIAVAAGAPVVPEALKQQLALGGRLVLPVGSSQMGQELLCITRVAEDKFETSKLDAVRFVPLIGEEGWKQENSRTQPAAGYYSRSSDEQRLIDRLVQVAEPFSSVDDLPLEGLLERIGASRLVLLGEASHGTSEFYRARQRIARALIEKKGFDFIALEGDWPDVARMDDYVRGTKRPATSWMAFDRFPTWMWRNIEVDSFVDWLREHNATCQAKAGVGLHGLDLYCLFRSINAVVEYLDKVDSKAAQVARKHYAYLAAYQAEPTDYGRDARSSKFVSCEANVIAVLNELLAKEVEYSLKGSEGFFDAVQNARLVVNAEAYYRGIYDPKANAWNQRDTHMFETLEALLAHYGEGSKGIVWAHNSHLGDARATESFSRGELNLGQLIREKYADAAYLIGFGTDHGTVAAASEWDAPMEIKTLRPALFESYEGLFHDTGLSGFLLPLGQAGDEEVSRGLSKPRIERAVGVIYRPETERASHYFEAELPRQFDEYIWIDRSRAVTTAFNQE